MNGIEKNEFQGLLWEIILHEVDLSSYNGLVWKFDVYNEKQ